MPEDELTVRQMIDALDGAKEWVTRARTTLEAGGLNRVIAGSGDNTITGAHLIAALDLVHQTAGVVRDGLDAIQNKDDVVFATSAGKRFIVPGPIGQKFTCSGPPPLVTEKCEFNLGPLAHPTVCRPGPLP